LRLSKRILLMISLFWASTVLAGVPISTSVVILPPDPRQGQLLLAVLWGTWSDGCVPESARLRTVGTAIYIDLITPMETNPNVLCTMALTSWQLSVPLGTFGPGDYEVLVRYRSRSIAGISLTVSATVQIGQVVTVPNGDFEDGDVGTLPEKWTLGEAFLQQGQRANAQPAEEHLLYLTNERHFNGDKSLYGMAKVIPPTDISRNHSFPLGEQFTYVWASSEWMSAPKAGAVELYMRDVEVKGNRVWGYGVYIILIFEDENGLHPNPFARWDVIWNSPQLLYGENETTGRIDNAAGTTRGNDGGTWKLYRAPIPAGLDRTKFKVKLFWIAHNWNSWGPQNWVSVSSHVDAFELTLAP